MLAAAIAIFAGAHSFVPAVQPRRTLCSRLHSTACSRAEPPRASAYEESLSGMTELQQAEELYDLLQSPKFLATLSPLEYEQLQAQLERRVGRLEAQLQVEPSESQRVLQKVRDAGVAGSYVAWELAYDTTPQRADELSQLLQSPDFLAKLSPTQLKLLEEEFDRRLERLAQAADAVAAAGVPSAAARGSPSATASYRGYRSEAQRSAPTIFFEGLENLKAEPVGWFFGAPSALYSNLPPRPGARPPWEAPLMSAPVRGGASSAGGPPSETKELLQKVKDAGVAGAISYAAWELAFWGVSVPVCIVGYQAATGHWPDFGSQEDLAQLGAEAFAFVNVARFAVPLRIGLALGTTPWVQSNIVDKFKKRD